MTEGVTSGTSDRAWYSVSSKGLLEAAKFVNDFSAEIGGTLKNCHPHFKADFVRLVTAIEKVLEKANVEGKQLEEKARLEHENSADQDIIPRKISRSMPRNLVKPLAHPIFQEPVFNEAVVSEESDSSRSVASTAVLAPTPA
jgi:hypothetical protein